MRDYEYDEEQPVVIIERRGGGLGAFVVGAALGAAMAILYAPASGVETRRDLKRRARVARERAREAADDIQDAVTDRYEQARRKVEERIDTARSAVELKKQQASEAIRAGRKAAQDARSDLERRIAEGKAAYRAGADVVRNSHVDDEAGRVRKPGNTEA
jgi:gas vesicle protein